MKEVVNFYLGLRNMNKQDLELAEGEVVIDISGKHLKAIHYLIECSVRAFNVERDQHVEYLQMARDVILRALKKDQLNRPLEGLSSQKY